MPDQKLVLDFMQSPSMVRHMDAETLSLVRALTTRIGMIMEDGATVALIWAEQDQLSPRERLDLLKQAGADISVIAEAALALSGRAEAEGNQTTASVVRGRD